MRADFMTDVNMVYLDPWFYEECHDPFISISSADLIRI